MKTFQSLGQRVGDRKREGGREGGRENLLHGANIWQDLSAPSADGHIQYSGTQYCTHMRFGSSFLFMSSWVCFSTHACRYVFIYRYVFFCIYIHVWVFMSNGVYVYMCIDCICSLVFSLVNSYQTTPPLQQALK